MNHNNDANYILTNLTPMIFDTIRNLIRLLVERNMKIVTSATQNTNVSLLLLVQTSLDVALYGIR